MRELWELNTANVNSELDTLSGLPVMCSVFHSPGSRKEREERPIGHCSYGD